MEHKLVQRCETKGLIFQLIGPGFCKNICLLSYFGVSCDGKSLRRKKEEYICVKLEVYSVLLQNKICCNVWVFSCYILSFEIVAAYKKKLFLALVVFSTGDFLSKNPAYGRQRISWPMRIVGPIQFWRGCVIYLKKKNKKK